MDGRYLKTIIHQIGFAAKLKGFTIFSGISAAENKGFVAERGLRECKTSLLNCSSRSVIIAVAAARSSRYMSKVGHSQHSTCGGLLPAWMEGVCVLGEKVGGVGRVSGAWWPARCCCCISSAAAPTIRRSRPELQQCEGPASPAGQCPTQLSRLSCWPADSCLLSTNAILKSRFLPPRSAGFERQIITKNCNITQPDGCQSKQRGVGHRYVW